VNRGCNRDDPFRLQGDAHLFGRQSPAWSCLIYKGTSGPDAIDIRKLYAQTGRFTYDPGFLATAACNSTITYIDGDKGELLYRGYPIEQLATQCDYLETCFLLLKGSCPMLPRRRPSATSSPITRWSTSRCSSSCAASGATRTRWRS
jgi:hypothetical protein